MYKCRWIGSTRERKWRLTDPTGQINPDIKGIVKTKLTNGVDSHLVCLKGFRVARRERKDGEGMGVVLIGWENLKLQELLVDDSAFRQNIMKKNEEK